MQVTVETASGLERRMTIQVPEEQIATEVQKRLKSMGPKVRLHGFRPGKVPTKVLERTYGKRVRQEVVSAVLQSSLVEAFGKEQLNPAGQPNIDSLESAPGQGLSYTAVFEVYPEVTLPDFRSLKLTRIVAQVSEEDVERMIETLRRQRRTWEAVEREAAEGDRVVMDYTGTVDGTAFEGNQGSEVPMELGSGKFIDGFEDGLRGVKAGEERVLDLQFPEGYHAKGLAGKPVQFTARVLRVEEARLADVDETFIRSFGVEEGGVEALRKEVHENMERELSDNIRAKVQQGVMDTLRETCAPDLPKALVDNEVQRLMQQTRDSLNQKGAASVDFEMDPSMFEEQGRRRVAIGLILAEIIKANGMSADPAKVRARAESIASTYQNPSQMVSWYYAEPGRLAEIESMVMEEQIVDWILEQADVTDTPMTFDEVMNPGQTSA